MHNPQLWAMLYWQRSTNVQKNYGMYMAISHSLAMNHTQEWTYITILAHSGTG